MQVVGRWKFSQVAARYVKAEPVERGAIARTIQRRNAITKIYTADAQSKG